MCIYSMASDFQNAPRETPHCIIDPLIARRQQLKHRLVQVSLEESSASCFVMRATKRKFAQRIRTLTHELKRELKLCGAWPASVAPIRGLS